MTQDRKDGIADELLQRYFDEELPAAERAQVEARLDDDARLRLDALGELRGLLRAGSAADAEGVDLSSTIAAIERGPDRPVAPSTRRRRAWLPVSAAGGFLAAAAALIFFLAPIDRVPTNEAEVEMLEVQGAVATVFRIEDHGDPSRTATVIWAEEDEPAAPAQGEVEE